MMVEDPARVRRYLLAPASLRTIGTRLSKNKYPLAEAFFRESSGGTKSSDNSLPSYRIDARRTLVRECRHLLQ